MEKKFRVDPKGHFMLSREEMQTISGGSLTETIVKLVIAGAEYCFNLGIREAKRMKALL